MRVDRIFNGDVSGIAKEVEREAARAGAPV